MNRRRYRAGQRVGLRASRREGWPREAATIVSARWHRSGVILVQVDVDAPEYGDDGLREITASQITRVLKKGDRI